MVTANSVPLEKRDSSEGDSEHAPPLDKYEELRQSQGEKVTAEQIELLRNFEAKVNKSVTKSAKADYEKSQMTKMGSYQKPMR